MKIAFLSGQNSIHTIKWVNEMANRGHEVHLITMHPGGEALNQNVNLYILPFKSHLGYYLNFWHLKRLLRKIKPDLLNTHYASGYGTLARLANFHPNLLSVWGSDIFEFPYESNIKMKIIKKNLQAADRIASTSQIMKKQIENIYVPQQNITVTPFGVDCEQFRPLNPEKDHNCITIGTVKSMDSRYGIKTLIEAFALVKRQYPGCIKLVLVGGGPQKKQLELLVRKLGIEKLVHFIGHVHHHTVPVYLNSFDIYVALSISESFGVAILEASACGLPVVVSDTGGLPEVVVDGKTGFVIPQNNPQKAANSILQLLYRPKLRKEMGKVGRQYVLNNFEWRKNAELMENLYNKIIT